MSSTIRHITAEPEAVDLAALLNSTSRTRPVVVVTTPSGRDTPYIDVEQISDEVGDAVDVVVLPAGDLSWVFSREMAEGTQVYGGAGRVYPVGVDWVYDLRKSPLRTAFSAADGALATTKLVSDCLHAAVAAGLLGKSSSNANPRFTGTVTGIVAGRAMVKSQAGGLATIVPEVILPGVSIEALVQPGMEVSGTLDEANRLHLQYRDKERLRYRTGDVVLARVVTVGSDTACLQLHPDVAVVLKRADVTPNDLDRLDELMTPGEVLRARVTSADPWSLRLADIDDDEMAIAPMALLDGGPPWLSEGLPAPEPRSALDAPCGVPTPRVLDKSRKAGVGPSNERAPVSPAAAQAAPISNQQQRVTPVPRPPRADGLVASQAISLEAANERIRQYHQTIEGLHAERDAVAAELERAQRRNSEVLRELAKRTQELRKSRALATRPDADTSVFLDPAEQFNHELYLAWSRRIPATEKADRQMTSYALGTNFLETLENVQGISRAKIIDVVVEILTGIAETQPGRALHRLRTALSGDAPARTRADGATAWRVSLQSGSPSARRLHYWHCSDGSVELSKVVLHDDFTI